MSIHLDLPDAEYRARPALSYSGAKTLMRSPALYAYELEHGRPPKTEFDVGHAAHTHLLGSGAPIAVIDAADWRTKEAKAARDAAREAGQTPLLAEQAAAVDAMVVAVRAHRIAGKLLEPGRGHGEVSVFWEQDSVPCRARLDWLIEDLGGRPAVIDLKTTDDVSDTALVRTVEKYRYHWQDAHYRDGLTAHGVDDAAFLFVFVEKTPPHLVRVVELDADAAATGERFMAAARDLYARCLAAGEWPGHPEEIHLLGLPRWSARTPEEN